MSTPANLRKRADRIEERRRSRARREREREREEQSERERLFQAHVEAARELSDDDLQAVAERPSSSCGGGRLMQNSHRVTKRLPGGVSGSVSLSQKAAERVREERERERREQARAAADGGRASVEIAGRRVPRWVAGVVALVVVLVALGDDEEELRGR